MLKTMKTGLKVIAWVGFGIFSLATVIALITTIGIMFPKPGQHIGVSFPHLYALVLAIIGLPLMLAGGIIAKPKHFWLLCLIVGLLYITGCIPLIQKLVSSIQHTEWDYLMQKGRLFSKIWNNLFILIPGIIVIAEGILIRRIEHRSIVKQQTIENIEHKY
jgi:hypothetical protein